MSAARKLGPSRFRSVVSAASYRAAGKPREHDRRSYQGKTLELELLFEDGCIGCIGVSCGKRETCYHGRCIDAEVNTARLPEHVPHPETSSSLTGLAFDT